MRNQIRSCKIELDGFEKSQEMDIEELLTAVDDLSPEELSRLKARIAAREQIQSAQPRSVDEWMAELDRVAKIFRGDSTDEEMAEIVAAMTTKSTPSTKGL
jgi:hypothetical protein